MNRFPPRPLPEPYEPEDSSDAFAEYEEQPPLRGPGGWIDRTGPIADVDTQPTPTMPGSSTWPAPPARVSRADFSRRQADSASPMSEPQTQRYSGAQASPPHARPPSRGGPPGQAPRRRRASARRSRFQAPPWLIRLGLLLGLVLLLWRAANASATFMAPGGLILGWSSLPVAQCKFCHPIQPTAQPGNKPLTPEQYAALLLPQLSLNEKLAQMMIVQFTGLQPTADAVQMINTQGVGGVILYGYNISTADQIKSLNSQLKQLSSIPLLTITDQEGGDVNRLENIVGKIPAASDLKDPADAESHGEQAASWLADFGFNLDLAPVVDVGTANPQLYSRTFGDDPARVAAMAGAYLQGLQKSGKITGTLKHYPGLGATTTDPHLGLPTLSRTKAEWEAIDLAPYRALLKSGDVRAIMVTHEMIPAVDTTYPASLSPALINGVLRGELGYNRVVITDSLYMQALTQWSPPQAAVLAIKAGADMFIDPANPQEVQNDMDALKQALADGTLSQSIIDKAVTRILALKIRMGLIPLPQA
jgi:beta-glucosidase-like glycosyl hydrolase